MAQHRDVDPPLRVYIDYEYLPIRQIGLILSNIAQTHRAILISMRKHSPAWSPKFQDPSPFDLCISTALTGESIELAFAPKGRVWPKIVFTQDHNLRIEWPRWSAPAMLVGAAVLGGTHIYDEFLDIELKHLEIQKAQNELALPAMNIERQLRDIDAEEIIASPYVSQWANNVRRRLNEPNIHTATINGIRVPPPVPREGREF